MADGQGRNVAVQGAARRIDQLGRVVVPAELRRLLGFHEGELLEFCVRGDELVLRRAVPSCAICGITTDDLVDLRDKHLCPRCVREIRAEVSAV